MKQSRFWKLQELKEIALRYRHRNQFKNGDFNAYECARRNGLLDAVCAHMTPGTSDHLIKWTLEKLTTEARKYTCRTDFCRGSNRAYACAYRRKLLDVVCAHMTPSPHKRRAKWSLEALMDEARKYDRRSDFWREATNLYQSARRRGLLDAVCAHMGGPHEQVR